MIEGRKTQQGKHAKECSSTIRCLFHDGPSNMKWQHFTASLKFSYFSSESSNSKGKLQQFWQREKYYSYPPSRTRATSNAIKVLVPSRAFSIASTRPPPQLLLKCSPQWLPAMTWDFPSPVLSAEDAEDRL